MMEANTNRSARALALGVAAGGASALAVGLPTAIIPSPWFTRMTPTRDHDLLSLVVSAPLAADIGATYASPRVCATRQGQLTVGGCSGCSPWAAPCATSS